MAALSFAVSLMMLSPAASADTLLADWEVAPTGSVFPGGDFDPTLDNAPSCSGCWYSRTAGSGVTYSQSTGTGATTGTHALEATIVGKGAGGEYAPVINGAPFMLDTHFDYPLIVTYSNTTNPAQGGPDPRFNAIKAAVDGNQGLFTLDFDITYDVAQMRSIPWQAPEQTNPPPPPDAEPFDYANQYPQRYFWVGMYGNANDPTSSGFQFVGFDANTINPFAKKWDTDQLPVFHASFPLSDFTFEPNSTTTFYQFGFLYNSVFGTLPASANTTGVHIYFDNFQLKEFDPVAPIDFNQNDTADLGDYQIFMAHHLMASSPLPFPPPDVIGDLVGDFGAQGTNGRNDFHDLLEFERLYNLANPGLSLAAALASIPEPSTLALVGLGLLGLVLTRARRMGRVTMLLAAAVVMASVHPSAQAQLIESFETLPLRFQPNPGAPAASNPSVMQSTIGVTHGTFSMKVTQAEDTIGDDDFVWVANTNPNWTTGDTAFNVLRNAVDIGAEHYNLLIDVTFRQEDLFDQGVNTLSVTFGLNFNGQSAGFYDSMAPPTNPVTTTIPLSAFNLPDVEDQGATSYSANIGFTADALQFPFSVYVDNIRLEQISTPDLLTLEIDRTSGAATLKNLTANPISWDYMEITSAGGMLDSVGWSSLDDQDADGPGTWTEAGGASATALVEASLLGSHTLEAGATLALGDLYNNPLNGRDLVRMQIRKAAGPSYRTYDQLVTYIGATPPPAVAGDYNNNGVVDTADYVIWRDHLGSNFQLLNEGFAMSPGAVTGADYTFWRSRFGATSGSGSGSGVGAGAAVPEPSTLMLCLCVVLAAWIERRRRIAR